METSFFQPCLPVGKSGGLLVQGDNLNLLRTLAETAPGAIRLLTIDPPFDTGVDWALADGQDVAFSDRWQRGEYMAMMRERLALVPRILAGDGSLLLHCDHRRAPHLALLCDEIFGEGARGSDSRAPGFRNEIVWLYGLGGSSPLYYPRKHDTLLWYSLSREWVFHPPMIPARSNRMKGQLKKCPDWWEIPTLNNMAAERCGYPTQKPLALLSRIVGAHSDPGDLVADLFCGSGTALVAAHRLGRRWLGCDASAEAIRLSRERLESEGAGFDFQSLSDSAGLRASQLQSR